MTPSATATWFAGHEIRLAWRELVGLLTAGRRWRRSSALIAIAGFVGLLHLPAYAVVGGFTQLQAPLDQSAMIVATAMIALAWALILSQAIESVTRVFYARADLDLIMSSPIALANVFSVRIAAIAVTVTAAAALLATPFIDVLVAGGGARWLAAYGLLIAIGFSAAAVAIVVTVTLFRLLGPARTRLAAQILSAITGAGFVIALQVAAILSTGTLSRFAVLTSDAAAAFAPPPDSLVWWPVHALLGDGHALLVLLAGSLMLLGVTMMIVSPRFADYVARVSPQIAVQRPSEQRRPFRVASQRSTLRRKELMLLWRDPWLVSQSLMQLLYLLPPALLMWRSFGESSGAILLAAPVIVMAAGQLAGGLAWLTISGEDAPDLVITAPLPGASLIRAKVETVLLIIGVLFAPLVMALAPVSAELAGVTALAVLASSASATAVQLWFRVQARRSQFRRRQTSSRIATFAEAMSSIGWSAVAALALVAPVAACVSAIVTVLLLLGTWMLSPRHA